jgi:hypothetical protein
MNENMIPVDGMVITEDTTLASGVYVLRDGPRIGADGVTLNGNGALLVNPSRQGAAIQAENRSGITLRNVAVSGFYHGIRFDHCRDVQIEQVRVRDTAEIEGSTRFSTCGIPLSRFTAARFCCMTFRRQRKRL